MTAQAKTHTARIDKEILDLIDCLLKAHRRIETRPARLLNTLRMAHEQQAELAAYAEDDLPF
jgi:hypothetical protein